MRPTRGQLRSEPFWTAWSNFLSPESIPRVHKFFIAKRGRLTTLVCDEIHVDRSGIVDLPDVVVDEKNTNVRICGSRRWNYLRDLASIFVGIMSHESIHLTLLRIDGNSSEYFDNIASLSAISRSLNDIPLIRKYSHGMIGLDL